MEQHGATAGAKVPGAVRKRGKSGKSPDVLFELLILGPWVRVPPGSPSVPSVFCRRRPSGGRRRGEDHVGAVAAGQPHPPSAEFPTPPDLDSPNGPDNVYVN